MGKVVILKATEEEEWLAWLRRSNQYDFYHLPSYHLLAEHRHEGEGRLLVYSEKEYFVALPILMRSVAQVEGLNGLDTAWMDVGSVYGYAGPIVSHEHLPEEFLEASRKSLHEVLQEMRVVTVFSRLHPLIAQRQIFTGLGKILEVGETVSIDLALPPEVQRARYRKDHKYGVNKLIRKGVICEEDTDWTALEEFVEIYHETMQRVRARDSLLYDGSYFRQFRGALGTTAHLFGCWLDGRIICGGLFTLCGGIVQYHLSGTRTQDLSLAPMKLLIDTVRLWANQKGARVFHLGGGLGSQRDSLFEFKAGFSDRRHQFAVWRWVLLPGIYQELCELRAQMNAMVGHQNVVSDFFPTYRAP